jgi:CsoR family transcriptional regulator, copper-sensing transcriptional repressor
VFGRMAVVYYLLRPHPRTALESKSGGFASRFHAELYCPDPLPGGMGNEQMRASKQDILNRLASIEGHLRGIRKMVDEDQYCVDILKQAYAVERALQKFEGTLLEGHLNGCVREGFQDGRDQEVIRELAELFELSRK